MGKIIDISHHQTVVDWKKVKQDVDLVIIRIQYGTTVIDRKKDEFITACKKHGIPFGLYAYGRFTSVADAKVEAKNFIKRGDKEALFWVLDTEDDTVLSCGTKNVAAASQAFINVLEDAGLKTGFYVANHRISSYGLSAVKADFRWIPRYSGTSQLGKKPTHSCDLWQFTETGRVNGISGNVDLNVLNGSKNLDWFLDDSKSTKPATKPVAKPVAAKPASTASVYVVKSGDSLSTIAAKHNTTVAKLVSLNGIKDKNVIRIGQILKTKAASTTVQTYTVKSGDTLGAIATKHKTTVAKLQKLNNIKDVNKISVGQKIKVK